MDKKSILSIVIVVVLCGLAAYQYINKDHRDIKKEKAAFTISASKLADEYTVSQTVSEKKYLNNTVEVSGKITELNESDLTIDGLIFCSFKKPIESSLKTNSQISVKGRVIGYDDLFEQVKLDQCSIID